MKAESLRFTYHRGAAELRGTLLTWLLVPLLDLIALGILGLLLPRPWGIGVILFGLAGTGVATVHLTAVLRTRHSLAGNELVLAYGPFRLSLPTEDIRRAQRHSGPLPAGLILPGRRPAYSPEEDALYLVADRRGLVAIDLRQPHGALVPRQGWVNFSRLVVSLDTPDAFLAALGTTPGDGGDGATAPNTTAPNAPAPVGAASTIAPVRAAMTARLTGPARQPDSPAALRLQGVVKRYGDFTAVAGIDLTVQPGEVLAFLGANGAGKTTTVRMAVGLLRPTVGRIEVMGRDVWHDGPSARRSFGYVPDVPVLQEGLTAREFLWFVAGLYGLPTAEGHRRAEGLLVLLGLESWGDHLVRAFSLGMKRRLAIAAALVHQPPVLILDEVTNGLDPRGARDVKDFIRQAARNGAAIFLTTHILDVAAELADRLAIIERGYLRAVGTMEELRQAAGLPGAGLEELFLTLTAPEGVAP